MVEAVADIKTSFLLIACFFHYQYRGCDKNDPDNSRDHDYIRFDKFSLLNPVIF